jgi:hypothetical protein
MGFRADVRAAAVAFLTDYAADANLRLQIYPARPRSIHTPTAFIDNIREARNYTGPTLVQRTPTVEIIVLHGLFDSKDAVDQGDAFVDGFLAWVDARPHQAGGSTTVGAVSTEDIPTFVPDWLPPALQDTYYATQIDLEGFATD